MLKTIDVLVGLKLFCNIGLNQVELAKEIASNPAQVNRAIKILLEAKLFTKNDNKLNPNIFGWEKLLMAIEYIFPAKIGGIALGMPTAYGAPPISNELHIGSDPIPVWPAISPGVKGISIEPLHPCIPKALIQCPDDYLYYLLVCIDAMRIGRARDKQIGKQHLMQKLNELAKRMHQK